MLPGGGLPVGHKRPEPVYNIEVDVDHCYRVGIDAIPGALPLHPAGFPL
jgi:hypothetical protein